MFVQGVCNNYNIVLSNLGTFYIVTSSNIHLLSGLKQYETEIFCIFIDSP